MLSSCVVDKILCGCGAGGARKLVSVMSFRLFRPRALSRNRCVLFFSRAARMMRSPLAASASVGIERDKK